MTPEEVLKAFAQRTPYCPDEGCNVVCHYCRYYRDFPQKDGARRGTHMADCVWDNARKCVEALPAQ